MPGAKGNHSQIYRPSRARHRSRSLSPSAAGVDIGPPTTFASSFPGTFLTQNMIPGRYTPPRPQGPEVRRGSVPNKAGNISTLGKGQEEILESPIRGAITYLHGDPTSIKIVPWLEPPGKTIVPVSKNTEEKNTYTPSTANRRDAFFKHRKHKKSSSSSDLLTLTGLRRALSNSKKSKTPVTAASGEKDKRVSSRRIRGRSGERSAATERKELVFRTGGAHEGDEGSSEPRILLVSHSSISSKASGSGTGSLLNPIHVPYLYETDGGYNATGASEMSSNCVSLNSSREQSLDRRSRNTPIAVSGNPTHKLPSDLNIQKGHRRRTSFESKIRQGLHRRLSDGELKASTTATIGDSSFSVSKSIPGPTRTATYGQGTWTRGPQGHKKSGSASLPTSIIPSTIPSPVSYRPSSWIFAEGGDIGFTVPGSTVPLSPKWFDKFLGSPTGGRGRRGSTQNQKELAGINPGTECGGIRAVNDVNLPNGRTNWRAARLETAIEKTLSTSKDDREEGIGAQKASDKQQNTSTGDETIKFLERSTGIGFSKLKSQLKRGKAGTLRRRRGFDSNLARPVANNLKLHGSSDEWEWENIGALGQGIDQKTRLSALGLDQAPLQDPLPAAENTTRPNSAPPTQDTTIKFTQHRADRTAAVPTQPVSTPTQVPKTSRMILDYSTNPLFSANYPIERLSSTGPYGTFLIPTTPLSATYSSKVRKVFDDDPEQTVDNESSEIMATGSGCKSEVEGQQHDVAAEVGLSCLDDGSCGSCSLSGEDVDYSSGGDQWGRESSKDSWVSLMGIGLKARPQLAHPKSECEELVQLVHSALNAAQTWRQAPEHDENEDLSELEVEVPIIPLKPRPKRANSIVKIVPTPGVPLPPLSPLGSSFPVLLPEKNLEHHHYRPLASLFTQSRFKFILANHAMRERYQTYSLRIHDRNEGSSQTLFSIWLSVQALIAAEDYKRLLREEIETSIARILDPAEIRATKRGIVEDGLKEDNDEVMKRGLVNIERLLWDKLVHEDWRGYVTQMAERVVSRAGGLWRSLRWDNIPSRSPSPLHTKIRDLHDTGKEEASSGLDNYQNTKESWGKQQRMDKQQQQALFFVTDRSQNIKLVLQGFQEMFLTPPPGSFQSERASEEEEEEQKTSQMVDTNKKMPWHTCFNHINNPQCTNEALARLRRHADSLLFPPCPLSPSTPSPNLSVTDTGSRTVSEILITTTPHNGVRYFLVTLTSLYSDDSNVGNGDDDNAKDGRESVSSAHLVGSVVDVGVVVERWVQRLLEDGHDDPSSESTGIGCGSGDSENDEEEANEEVRRRGKNIDWAIRDVLKKKLDEENEYVGEDAKDERRYQDQQLTNLKEEGTPLTPPGPISASKAAEKLTWLNSASRQAAVAASSSSNIFTTGPHALKQRGETKYLTHGSELPSNLTLFLLQDVMGVRYNLRRIRGDGNGGRDIDIDTPAHEDEKAVSAIASYSSSRSRVGGYRPDPSSNLISMAIPLVELHVTTLQDEGGEENSGCIILEMEMERYPTM